MLGAGPADAQNAIGAIKNLIDNVKSSRLAGQVVSAVNNLKKYEKVFGIVGKGMAVLNFFSPSTTS